MSKFAKFYSGLQWLISSFIVVLLGLVYGLGLFFNVLLIFFILSSIVRCFSTLGYFSFGLLDHGFRKKPKQNQYAFTYMLSQWFFIITTYLCVQSALIPIQFTQNELIEWKSFVALASVIHFILSFIPPINIYKSWLFFYLLISLFISVELIRYHWPYKVDSSIELMNPLATKAVVFQGGRSSIYNHHYSVSGQSYAVDLVPDASMAQTQMTTLNDFPCFNSKIFAPIDGEVHKVRDGIHDNSVGTTNVKTPEGNFVILKTMNDKFAILAHFKKGSIKVNKGDAIKKGQFIGKCGNSGNSTAPHVHLQIQNEENMWSPTNVTFPIKFLSNSIWVQPKRNLILDAGQDLRNN